MPWQGGKLIWACKDRKTSRKSLIANHPGCILLQGWNNFTCPQRKKQMAREEWTDEWVNLKELSNSLKGKLVFYASYIEITDTKTFTARLYPNMFRLLFRRWTYHPAHSQCKWWAKQFSLELPCFLHLQFRQFMSLGIGNNGKYIHLLSWHSNFSYFSDLRASTHSLKKESSLCLFSKLTKMHIKAIVINNSFPNSFQLQ